MEKRITFTPCKWERKLDNDAIVCRFGFSVVDPSIIGTPRERSTDHSIRITASKSLRENWGINTPRGSDVSDDMIKVAFQLVLDEITERLRKGDLPDDELSLSRDTSNSEESCPYQLSNIAYPDKMEFTVSLN